VLIRVSSTSHAIATLAIIIKPLHVLVSVICIL